MSTQQAPIWADTQQKFFNFNQPAHAAGISRNRHIYGQEDNKSNALVNIHPETPDETHSVFIDPFCGTKKNDES